MTTYTVFKDVVLFILAIYAAALSTFNLIQSLRKDRRSVKVTFNTVMPDYGQRLGPPFALLQAVNAGHRTVIITLLTLQLPDGKRLMPLMPDGFPGMADSDFPATLGEGAAARRIFSYERVAQALLSNGYESVDLTPICEDSLGHNYRGKPLKIDARQWLAMVRA